MDRASGSGVFARDPDAILDMIELELSGDVLKQEENKAICAACRQYLDAHYKWEDDLSQDDLCSSYQMLNYCENKLSPAQWAELKAITDTAKTRARSMTAWRIEGTLREYPKFPAVNLWFDYPCHRSDDAGILGDIQPEAERAPWQKKKKTPEQRKKEKEQSLLIAFDAAEKNEDGAAKISDLADIMGISLNTAKKYVDASKELKRDKDGMVSECQKH